MVRILVIDDDRRVLRLAGGILAAVGREVLFARDGEEGLDLHRRKPFDLVVTDIHMPKMDGIETIRALRADHEDLPIIAMSGSCIAAPLDFLRIAKILGADAAIKKPLDGERMLSTVNFLLGAAGS